MKKTILLTLVGLCIAAAAYGLMGDIVASFQVSNNCGGLAIAPGYLICNDYSPGVVYLAHPDTGSVYSSFTGTGNDSRGMAYAGTYLWQNKGYNAPYLTHRMSPTTGTIYASYAIPSRTTHGLAPLATGDYGAGTTALIHSDYSLDGMYLMNMSGSITNTFSVPSECSMYEIAYDWRNQLIWGAQGASSGYIWIWGVTTTGSLATSFSVPNTYASNAYGLTYAGEYLWAGSTSGYIIKIHCPISNINVAPSSMGKIKAVYR